MTLVRFNGHRPSTPVFNLLENFFGRDINDVLGSRETNGTVPAVNIKENEDLFVVEVAAPGMQKENFEVNLNHNVLTISSHVENNNEEKKEHYTRREFSYSSFQRSFTLPNTVDVEKIEAKYNNGLLCITIPKREEAKPRPARTIQIG